MLFRSGLDDSVTDISQSLENADGIKFREYSVRALAKAIRKAMVLFTSDPLMSLYRRNGMTVDFSWDRTAQDYLKVFERPGV